ncbi:hypothetical protein Kisp01_69540 [Kineosporia sp. NBRC 101677]|uniref:DUF6414 family protein n=1 Tax=Kineosporia sp. NBRC 101677 TaxID=3032197 RepID=UPI0024A0BAE7|nr:DUF6414 family protein [Kineosporia sp. NBRC 101677]GLY19940.1 hypothetical protein Kisp01_69540 [Kineosporia sp. NBRC 101677]
MPAAKHHELKKPMIKIVYFDEESASDYLDITAGGKTASTSQQVKERTTDMHARVETSIAAKFSWLPFLGTSAEVGAGMNASQVGRGILSKTLSNTILTDYLAKVEDSGPIKRLSGLKVTAPQDSMAYMKMYTPYMIIIAKDDELGIDFARLDEALEGAKGYYELLGENAANGNKCVLRFNIKAFRNNYGLTDLGRMRLVFHGVLVGQTSEDELGMQAEMADDTSTEPVTALTLIDGADLRAEKTLLDVYDVLLAGVEYVE